VKARKLFSLLRHSGSIRALITWPEFSITSFNMVSELAKQGILPRTVLDVGANVGQFAVAAAKLFPSVQVHAFEPVPECAQRLQDNVAGLGNVTVYPFALGDSEGKVTFRVNSFSPSSSILPLARGHLQAFPEAQETQEIMVKVSTLDRIFANIELQAPILLKLDVQGYEAYTLRGGIETLKRLDYVVLETSFKPMYEGESLFMDIVRIMEGQNFHFERPVGWLAEPETGEILQMDALFTRAV
jgi:FkbM family methyltransferase